MLTYPDADAGSFFSQVEGKIPERLKSNRLRAFLSYWLQLAGGDVPARADLDPAAIKPILPYLMLVDLSEDPFRIFYRLVGTEVVNFAGLNFAGHFIDELEFDEFDLASLIDAYRQVRDSRKPGAGVAKYHENGMLMIETEYLICPLRSTSDRIDKCVVIEDYFSGGGMSISDLPPARFRR